MQSDQKISPPPQYSEEGICGHAGFRTAVVGLVLVMFGLALYRDFVFGERTLLYKDIGSDSINVFYPYYVLLSDYIRQIGIPSWSFQVGMGQNLFPYTGMVLLNPVVWLAKSVIAKALVYQHLLYVVIAGVLFARFLANRGLNFASCVLGALLLCFSAYMCMGSCWYFQANEVVCFTFLLFAAEQAVSRGRWLYLAPAVALVGLLSAFHLYLAALLLCFYVPGRVVEKYSWQPLSILRVSFVLAAAAALGMGLAAIITLPNVLALLNSPRGSGTMSLTGVLSSSPIFRLESSLHYITALFRQFTNDILGTGSEYRGWGNYLEAPISYCGLLSLVLFPQIFVGATRRAKFIYGAFVGLVLIVILFPWFRYLFWAFQGDYYRTFSLFAVFGILTLGMTAFSRYGKGERFNPWVLLVTTSILLTALHLPFRELQAVVSPMLKWTATVFLVLYTALLMIGRLARRQTIAASLIIGLAALELIFFDRITIANRPTVTKQELAERVGYNDLTVDAIRDIKASDDSFFRVTKTWGSGPAAFTSLNDAMVFGYYGTSSYSSFNNLNFIKFLLAVDAISPKDLRDEMQFSRGLLGQPLLSTFACEKYVVTNQPAPFQTNNYYEAMTHYDDVYVFRNKLSVPFGLCFKRYVSEDLFLRLPSGIKAATLFHAVVLSDKKSAEKHGLSELTMEQFKEQLAQGSIPEVISARRSNALHIDSFKQTRIDGNVRLEEKSIMVLQTPFDIGWRAYQDGRFAPTLKVDCGLQGVVLDGGEHKVQLRYHPPLRDVGAAVSLASLSLLAIAWWRWPRVALPKIKTGCGAR